MEHVLTLPYPLSANRYWKTFVFPCKQGGKKWYNVKTTVTAQATMYKTTVATMYLAKKYPKIIGKVDIEWWLFPHRPLDWNKRQERDYQNWDLTVQRIDIDNVNKVLFDALKNVAFEDDKMIMNNYNHVMEPDDKGARIVVSIQPTELKVIEELF